MFLLSSEFNIKQALEQEAPFLPLSYQYKSSAFPVPWMELCWILKSDTLSVFMIYH